MKDKAVVILSGGLDSTTLLYEVRTLFKTPNVSAISFNYGQKHSKELSMATKTCKYLGIEHIIINIPELGAFSTSSLTSKSIPIPEGHYEEESMKSTVVPNRNMVLISLAASYAISKKAQFLYYGAHSGDHVIYPDCRPQFVNAMGVALNICDWTPLVLDAPYLKLNKGDIVSKGLKLGVRYDWTWTCYRGEELACGKCGSCIERLEAFEEAGCKDPVKYEEKVVL